MRSASSPPRRRPVSPAALPVALAWGCWSGCAGLRADPFEPRQEWSRYTHARGGPQGAALAGAVLRAEVCEGENLRPEYARLDETDLVAFLSQHATTTSVERPRSDLAYVSMASKAGKPLRLRVAILGSADAAGQELAAAIAEHGEGAWGVHRSNLAVLGPPDAPERVIDLVSASKLACWGVFTLGSAGEVFVIPGGYREL